MLIYMAVGAAGLVLLLAMLVLGDLFGGGHDVAHGGADSGGPGVLSLPVMTAFATAFGVGGVVARYYGSSHPVASAVGVATGIVLATVVYQFGRLLHAQQASTDLRMSRLVGEHAVVSVAIPAGGVGQVTMSVAGEMTEHVARAAAGIAVRRGESVRVTALGGDAVFVEPLAGVASKRQE